MLTLLSALVLLSAAPRLEPISLHPQNPHLFVFRGDPTLLITSGEHYGAVLNLDFDQPRYLDELAKRGFNLTRAFSGTYREVPGSFKIQHNTLAPKSGRYQGPWVALADGKFDLDRFDPAYFERLKSFLTLASSHQIVVEFVLFCPMYEEVLWEANPMNARNNINGIGKCAREEVYTLKHPDLLARQIAFVKRVVGELNDFDNLYFEVCNEPYFGGVTAEWQDRVIATIGETEKPLSRYHLIAQNIANGKSKVASPNPATSIFNFHYATPPLTVSMNFELERPIGDDETGFHGTGDRFYRTEAWEFLLAGGSVFNNLDYSFTIGHEDGSAKVEDPTPGGGGPNFRSQIAFLKKFLESFDLVQLQPNPSATVVRGAPKNVRCWSLAAPGEEYAVYLREGARATIGLPLPAGRFRFEWLNPLDGKTLGEGVVQSPGGPNHTEEFVAPDHPEDIALKVLRVMD